MSSILSKILTLFRSLYGYCIKWLYDLHLLHVPSLHERKEANLIVSLTSYGRRVSSGVVCYSIYSILRQTIQPKRIILWLTDREWTDAALPTKVAKLREYGVEIRYCEDMCSYKKLIPTCRISGDTIVTIDDDVLYPSTLIETLNNAHAQYPQAIIASYLRRPMCDGIHFVPYVNWPLDKPSKPTEKHLPIGVGGCLYPAGSLKKEMLDYEQAKVICPLADDIWFWAAGIAAGTKKIALKKRYNSISFDAIYQFLHSGSALQHANVKGHSGLTNDEQIAAVSDYLYNHYAITLL